MAYSMVSFLKCFMCALKGFYCPVVVKTQKYFMHIEIFSLHYKIFCNLIFQMCILNDFLLIY